MQVVQKSLYHTQNVAEGRHVVELILVKLLSKLFLANLKEFVPEIKIYACACMHACVCVCVCVCVCDIHVAK